eukprot:1184075-Pyramimonas_sp.AAC.1
MPLREGTLQSSTNWRPSEVAARPQHWQKYKQCKSQNASLWDGCNTAPDNVTGPGTTTTTSGGKESTPTA